MFSILMWIAAVYLVVGLMVSAYMQACCNRDESHGFRVALERMDGVDIILFALTTVGWLPIVLSMRETKAPRKVAFR